jgi:hypothetical protein
MMQTLRKSYHFHILFEDTLDNVSGERVFRETPVDMEIVMSEKKVTFESDRPILLFLERQTKLLE